MHRHIDLGINFCIRHNINLCGKQKFFLEQDFSKSKEDLYHSQLFSLSLFVKHHETYILRLFQYNYRLMVLIHL